MVKKLRTKAEIRAEIENQISDYLLEGGHVEDCPRGQSGREAALHPFKVQPNDKPAEPRTPVGEAIAAIESRKHSAPAKKQRPSKPKKILIKDDFGQPLRWVWED